MFKYQFEQKKVERHLFHSFFEKWTKLKTVSEILPPLKVSRMNTKERADVAKEVELLSKLSHPNIVQYVDSFSDNIG